MSILATQKLPRLHDCKLFNIRNIDQLAIVQPRGFGAAKMDNIFSRALSHFCGWLFILLMTVCSLHAGQGPAVVAKQKVAPSAVSPLKGKSRLKTSELSLFTGVGVQNTVGKTVVLDAGHGGLDIGARGHQPYCEEKRITLQTARLVKKYLNQLGYHVIMTRSTDGTVSLAHRANVANKAGSELFVSIHFNSSRTTSAHGIEIFYCNDQQNLTRSNSSKQLASQVLSRVIQRTQAVSRGVKKGNFYVIRETQMPAILVEGGFISNLEERLSLKDPEYLDKLARGIVDGIDLFLSAPVRKS